MAYQKKTGQFPDREMQMLSDYGAAVLVPSLIQAGPVVALRAAAEVMLNEDSEKLQAMLAFEDFVACWRAYEDDLGVDARDHEYAEKLEAALAEMNQ